MILAIGWPHDPGETRVWVCGAGPMILAIGWPHDPGEIADFWPLVGGD